MLEGCGEDLAFWLICGAPGAANAHVMDVRPAFLSTRDSEMRDVRPWAYNWQGPHPPHEFDTIFRSEYSFFDPMCRGVVINDSEDGRRCAGCIERVVASHSFPMRCLSGGRIATFNSSYSPLTSHYIAYSN